MPSEGAAHIQNISKTRSSFDNESQAPSLQTSCRPLYVFPGGQGNLEARYVLYFQGAPGPSTPIITIRV